LNRSSGRVFLALGVSLLFVFFFGCTTLDDKKIEDAIQTDLAGKGIKVKTFDCPEGRPLRTGDKFDCSAVDQDNRTLIFHVEQTNDSGSINWKMEGVILEEAKLGDSIEAKIGQAADVQCPAKTIILKVGDSFTCPVLIGSDRQKVTLTLTSEKGDVAWKVQL
jgi:hypothetical protein